MPTTRQTLAAVIAMTGCAGVLASAWRLSQDNTEPSTAHLVRAGSQIGIQVSTRQPVSVEATVMHDRKPHYQIIVRFEEERPGRTLLIALPYVDEPRTPETASVQAGGVNDWHTYPVDLDRPVDLPLGWASRTIPASDKDLVVAMSGLDDLLRERAGVTVSSFTPIIGLTAEDTVHTTYPGYATISNRYSAPACTPGQTDVGCMASPGTVYRTEEPGGAARARRLVLASGILFGVGTSALVAMSALVLRALAGPGRRRKPTWPPPAPHS
jgi:hypothetical protein